MNKSMFHAKLRDAMLTSKINVTLLSEWFAKILEVLNSLSRQLSAIEHPGERGDSREWLLRARIGPLLPDSLRITKGFAVDRYLTVSRQQDIMIVNRDSAMSLIPDQRYYPIHSCLASIEVKSHLTVSETRKAILNCISVKKLLDDQFPKTVEDDRIGEYCYALFAYTCRKTLNRIADDVNDALVTVPLHLRPNIVYILGKGMPIPSETRKISVGLGQMFCDGPFRPVPEMGAPPSIPASEAYAFLWFLANIVDHCLQERGRRPDFVFRYYWETVLGLQAAVNKIPLGAEAPRND